MLNTWYIGNKKVSCGQETLIIVTRESTLLVDWLNHDHKLLFEKTHTHTPPNIASMGERIISYGVGGFGAHWITHTRSNNTAKAKATQRSEWATARAMPIFHSSFNVVRIYVMHVYCLTEINTLNLTTIYKVFAYVIFHDKVYTRSHIRWGFFSARLACVRSFLFILHVGFY